MIISCCLPLKVSPSMLMYCTLMLPFVDILISKTLDLLVIVRQAFGKKQILDSCLKMNTMTKWRQTHFD